MDKHCHYDLKIEYSKWNAFYFSQVGANPLIRGGIHKGLKDKFGIITSFFPIESSFGYISFSTEKQALEWKIKYG